MNNTKIIKLFLASSGDLKEEREKIKALMTEMNNEYIQKNIYIEPVCWENLSHSHQGDRIQDSFNQKMLECDIVLSLFYTKVGQFTKEEFEIARNSLNEEEKPNFLYVYFKEGGTPPNYREYIKVLELREQIENSEQIYDTFNNFYELETKLKHQLHIAITEIQNKDIIDSGLDDMHDDTEDVGTDKTVTFRNPYSVRGMLEYNSELFFGRKDLLKRIETELFYDNPQCLSIQGEKRIGKSSLINQVYHEAIRKEYAAIMLNCQGLIANIRKYIKDIKNAEDEFFKLLNSEYLICLNTSQSGNKSPGFYDFISFLSFIKKEAAEGQKFLIIFDEFEYLVQAEFADEIFFANLRSIANDPFFNLAYITITQKTLLDLEREYSDFKSSTFAGIFANISVGLLEKESIDDLRQYGFKKHNDELDEKKITLINEYAGLHPYYNNMICNHLYNEKYCSIKFNSGVIEIELEEQYFHIWKHLTGKEKELMEKLAKKSIDDIKKIRKKLLNKLENRGLIIKKDGNYSPFSSYFSKCIKDGF